jgi:DHA2 family multidrug resistance protein
VTGVVQFLSAPVAGALSRRIDLRLMLALGLSLFGTGVWMMSFLDASWGFGEFFLPQVVRASALMICIVPINSLTLGTLPPDKVKNASGLYNLMRNLGGAIGLAAINTVLSQRVQLHWNRLAAKINPARPGVQDAIDHISTRLGDVINGDPNAAAIRLVSQLVSREAMVMTLNDCLLLVAAAFGCALLLMPLVRKPREAITPSHAAE